ncbi:hypothetical protein F2Q68_00007359 [Brassica cretica]|uniref:Uncharacterized protein n=2 Tax=Brassica cretica TaxID=69181 RepID=A0A8S9KU77_BRACR|nr:hypothetical protein F2Q68_00007359 [Brassica cretica]
MSTSKPQRSPAKIEDIILRKIFYVTLTDSTTAAAAPDPRVVYLEMTAAEILSEGRDLLLSRDLMERVLIDRLSGTFPAAEQPFPYLVGCYRRAHEESRKIQSMKDKNLRSEMEIVTREAKRLAVSYCRIHLANPDMFGSVDDKPIGGVGVGMKKRSVSPLLPLIFSEVGSGSLDMFGGGSSSGGGAQSPPGFLDEFFKDSDFDNLDVILKELYEDLRSTVINVSVLGDFQPPLRALKYLVSLPVGAKSLVSHEWWVPRGAYMNGRAMELTSIVGPFFHISALPDNTLFKSQPDVG